jgi:Carbohydrate binding domain
VRPASRATMTDQNLRTIHRTTGVSITFAALVVLGVYACSDVSNLPDDNTGGGGSAGSAAAGSSGAGGVSGANAGTGGSAGASGSGSGSAGSGGSPAAAGSGGSGSGTGGSSSGAAGSSAGSSGSAGSSSDPDAGVGSAPDAALPDGGALENLISNSDFESGISPWTAAFGGVLSATTEQAHGGLQSAKVTGRAADYQGAHYDVTDFVTQGATYTVTAFARIDGATATATVKTTARVKCATLADQYVPIRLLTANDSSWTELTGNLTVPALPPSGGPPTNQACTLLELLVYVEGPPAAYDLYVDDVSMLPL